MSEPALIRRARFAGGGDPTAARRRLERQLATADWSVPALPPAAILCVRTLRAAAHRPGGVAAALADCAGRAARPARAFVPAAADAVWFASAAEWLACLARDAVTGDLASRWWWEAVRREAGGGPVASRGWAAEPRSVPAAWELLAGWGLAGAFAAALAPRDATAVAVATAVAFGLPVRTPVRGVGPLPHLLAGLVREAFALPPGPNRVALAQGLMLARAPHHARQPGVASRLDSWAEFGDGRPHALFEPGRRPDDRSATTRRGPPEGDPGGVETRRPPDSPPDSPVRPPPGGPDEAFATRDDRGRKPDDADAAPTPQPPDSLRLRPTPSRDGRPTGEAAAGTTTDSVPTDTVEAAPVAGPVEPPEDGRIETAFGGLLYLVNVGLSLGLYPDFTEPSRAGVALPLWDWLAALGRRWGGEAFLDDPLDELLAALARRGPDVPPGTGVDAPGGWRLPDTWGRWVEEPQPDAWDSLDGWLDWVAAVVGRRLAEALDRPDPAEARRWLIRRRATVFVAAERLDVVLPLADLAVEIRAALLDRDPGWLPSAGTTVRFHYDHPPGHRR